MGAFEREEYDIPDTEPEVIQELLVGELSATRVAGAVRFIGTLIMTDTRGKPVERRIVLRFTVPLSGLGTVCEAMCHRKAD